MEDDKAGDVFARDVRPKASGSGETCSIEIGPLTAWGTDTELRELGERYAEAVAAVAGQSPPKQPHGTYATYKWHRRRGVPMCDDCRAAYNARRRERAKRTEEET